MAAPRPVWSGMTVRQDPVRLPANNLRLWPAVLVVALQCLGSFVVPALVPGAGVYGILAGAAGGLLVLLWWLFFSRAPWLERLGVLLFVVAAVSATFPFVHESIANGMMGMMLPIMSLPVLSLALVAALMASRRRSSLWRRVSIAIGVVLACGAFTLVRTGGLTGDAKSDLHWRWTRSPEERLLAAESTIEATHPAVVTEPPSIPAPSSLPALPADVPVAPPEESEGDAASPPTITLGGPLWPGFRGPARDGVVAGTHLAVDWVTTPPVNLWRRPIGPGWSSFAVHRGVLFTQEQRGDDEDVSAYSLATGELVWRHQDGARFWESNGGAGPRATPTFDSGRVYALGATGILNALDARDGRVLWSRNAQSDTGEPIPGWGFAGSPLVASGRVIVATGGRLAAYDAATGTPLWTRETSGGGYSSPQWVMLHGVAQILLASGGGLTSVAPEDGSLLWNYRSDSTGTSIIQPSLTSDGDVLVGAVDASAAGAGTRRIGVSPGRDGWTVQPRWTSTGLKPSFNDVVVHKGYAFGFDGGILACIDLADGTRRWKGGRYGYGQLILLRDQDLLLVLSEQGEIALVAAAPDHFTELARLPAVEGKTWNHPVLVGDVLLVRNGEEMAAFRLPLVRH